MRCHDLSVLFSDLPTYHISKTLSFSKMTQLTFQSMSLINLFLYVVDQDSTFSVKCGVIRDVKWQNP